MKIELTTEMQRAIGVKDLNKVFGINKDGRHYDIDIYLPSHSTESVESMLEVVQRINAKGDRSAASILKKFLEVVKGNCPKATGALQMVDLMKSYIASQAKDFRLCKKQDGRWYQFFVNGVIYIPENRSRDNYHPAQCRVELRYVAFGKGKDKRLTFDNSECRTTAPALLARERFVVETPEIRQECDKSLADYCRLVNEIGLQCTTSGYGYQSRGWREEKYNNATAFGSESFHLGLKEPSLVVVDLYCDDESDNSNRRSYVDPQTAYDHSWRSLAEQLRDRSGACGPRLDEDDFDEDELEGGEAAQNMLPVHPMIPIFDLRRHDWFTVHASDLDVYVYDKTIDEKLIISDGVKGLVAMLAASKGDKFKDVVAGKSGGTTVLLAGPPGVGKTLTAEVFSEKVEKPLYRVQCSQLGIDPDKIEEELMAVFQRASRWKAIILLDESDVYISKRGANLTANAIVGVFLRVLEYQNTVLFMTTNLPESVDDAIASRCIARIDYSVPPREDLKQIWRTLADNAGMKISDGTIETAVENYPRMSGRDVKNTLKLIMAREDGQLVSFDAIKRAAKFHPNRGNWAA